MGITASTFSLRPNHSKVSVCTGLQVEFRTEAEQPSLPINFLQNLNFRYSYWGAVSLQTIYTSPGCRVEIDWASLKEPVVSRKECCNTGKKLLLEGRYSVRSVYYKK